jgi:hypothetical protein
VDRREELWRVVERREELWRVVEIVSIKNATLPPRKARGECRISYRGSKRVKEEAKPLLLLSRIFDKK